MQNDLALTAARVDAFDTCMQHVRAAEASAGYTAASPAVRKALAINAALCQAARKRAASARVTYNYAWLKDAVKAKPHTQFVLDKRFNGLLNATVPDARLADRLDISLRVAVKLSVWLPQSATLFDDRYILLRGCEPHNCGNKGFIWIDTARNRAIVMTDAVLASMTTNPRKIPPEFWQQVELEAGETMAFIDRHGRQTNVEVPDL